MTIKTQSQIAIGFGVIVCSLGIAALVWAYSQLQIVDAESAFADELNTALVRLDLLSSELVLHSSPRVRYQWRLQHKRVVQLVGQSVEGGSGMTTLLAELQRRAITLGRLFDKIETTTEDPAKDAELKKEAIRILFAGILAQSAAMHSKSLRVQQFSRSDSGIIRNRVTFLVALAFLGIIFMMFATYFVLGRRVLRRIIELRATLRRIGRGNLEESVPSAKADEIGDAFRDVEAMRQELLLASKKLLESNKELKQSKKLLEQRVAERTIELTAANKELEAFAYSVSHDLRAPLRSMSGFCMALQEDYSEALDEDAQDYLFRITRASKRMGLLIDDMLELSRITRKEITKDSVDLTVIAEEFADTLSRTDPERDVKVDIAQDLLAEGDEALLRATMQNLIGNAWKFTRHKKDATIEVGRLPNGSPTTFFVRDNGVGFDMAYADKLFAPFQRLHSEKEFEGTGIGLASVARIIHRHGGKVWADGQLNDGATLYFTLRPGDEST